MTDRERHHLRGPVQSVQFEFAADPQTGSGEALRQGPGITFDRDGRLEGHSRDEPTPTVDEDGLRTTAGPHPPHIPRPQGTEYGLSLHGEITLDVVTHYDRSDRPVDISYRNADTQGTLY